jgi:hypothetical protein
MLGEGSVAQRNAGEQALIPYVSDRLLQIKHAHGDIVQPGNATLNMKLSPGQIELCSPGS